MLIANMTHDANMPVVVSPQSDIIAAIALISNVLIISLTGYILNGMKRRIVAARITNTEK
jgi:hypothetical protein